MMNKFTKMGELTKRELDLLVKAIWDIKNPTAEWVMLKTKICGMAEALYEKEEN